MARLIPNIHDGEIQLRLDPRQPFWRHRTLMFALGVAVVLHVIALALFRVPDVVPNSDERVVAPIRAIADANSGIETWTLAHLTVDRRMRFLAPPRSGPPPLPGLLESIVIAPSNLVIIDAEFEPSPSRFKAERHLQWLLSGPLAGEKILSELPAWIDEAPSADQRLRFALQIDQISGKVLWIQLLEAPGQKNLTARVEDVIRHMRFQPRPNGGVNQGELELLIYGDESS